MKDDQESVQDDSLAEFHISRHQMLGAAFFNLVPGFGLGYYLAHRRTAFWIAFGLSITPIVVFGLALLDSPDPEGAAYALPLFLAVLAGINVLTALEQFARGLGRIDN